MKTKQQKKEQIEKGGSLLKDSKVLIFTDFSKLPAEDMRKLRREILPTGAKLFVIKKRLLGVLMKQNGYDIDLSKYKMSVGTVFSPVSLEEVSGPVYKFFKGMKLEKEKVLGGYDVAAKSFIEPATIAFIGELPPREVLLGQLLGMLSSPIRSFLYVLDQKSKQTA
jgi:large subunit ribosomal protein L10